jgi:hypothetical protein
MATGINNGSFHERQNGTLAEITHIADGGSGQEREGPRRYTHRKEIEDLAVAEFRKRKRPLTTNLMVERGLATDDKQARRSLRHFSHTKPQPVLFTIKRRRPQEYWPACLRAEVEAHIASKEIRKNVTYGPTGLRAAQHDHDSSTSILSMPAHDQIVIQTLEHWLLPLLPDAPLYLHNIHLKFALANAECYNQLSLPIRPSHQRSRAKHHSEVIDGVGLDYIFYPNGTVEVYIINSRFPFKLQTDIDRSRILIFLGQVRQALIDFLQARHTVIVPSVPEWQVTGCEVNKDINIGSDWLQFSGLHIQMKHLDHAFSLYVKAMGRDAVVRTEQKLNVKRPVIEAIDDIFNPAKGLEKRIENMEKMLTQILHSFLKQRPDSEMHRMREEDCGDEMRG